MTLRLISRAQNSAGERVRIALNLKQIDYEYVSVDTLTPEVYRSLNPQGLLPALETENGIIAQSSAILSYLEELYPAPSLLPDDPLLRAQARAFAAYITSEIHAVMVKRIRNYLGSAFDIDEAGLDEWTQHWTNVGLSTLETTLSNRLRKFRFCFSEEPGWADLHLVPQLGRARRFGTDLSPYPLLRGIEETCNALEAFRQARPEAQSDFTG